MTRYKQSIKPQTAKSKIYEVFFQLPPKKLKRKKNWIEKKYFPLLRSSKDVQTETTKVLAL